MICFFCHVRGGLSTDALMIVRGISVCHMEPHVKAAMLGAADGIVHLNEIYGEV